MWTNDGGVRTGRRRSVRRDDRGPSSRQRPAASTFEHRDQLLDGEMLDLYAAILIAVPIALFIKSLWL
jgi:hypothetical protein